MLRALPAGEQAPQPLGPNLLLQGFALLGEVAEWSKANDSKSFEGKPSVGSNPTLSVLSSFLRFREIPDLLLWHRSQGIMTVLN